MKILSLLLAGISFSLAVLAQDKSPAKFGKVTPQDFTPKVYAIDSNANAVVLADVGSSKIVGNDKGWFSLEFKRYRRVHILNKNGFDVASGEIPLYSVNIDEQEKLVDFKAVTYNLENGKVVETPLDKSNIFKDKATRYWSVTKYTFPNIKEGSIIELQYTISSDFLQNLQPWAFQGDYPVLWSEYNLALPSFFSYAFISQGYQNFFINTKKISNGFFSVTERNISGPDTHYSVTANVGDYRWVIKDAPALKDESFVSTLKNHVQKVEFELTARGDPLSPFVYLSSWSQKAQDMIGDEDFGAALNKDNGWMGDIIKPLIAGAPNDLEKAKRIYAYCRDNLTCTGYTSVWLRQSLKNVVKTRNGTGAEINMLLTGMIRYAGLEADPMILSTRSHGYTYAYYPIVDKFNDVICCVNIDGQRVYLDASEPRLGFGRMTPDCYNGHAKIINESATDIDFSADSLMERKVSSIVLQTNDKGEFVGTMEQVPGYFESHEIRERVKEKGKDEFFKKIKKAYGEDVDLVNPVIDSLDDLDESVKIKYDFKMNEAKEDLLYINPMFGEGYKENPFKSAERSYPVEMPYAMDETYVFNLFVPDGYEIDELPKPMALKLNEKGDGRFEFLLSQNGSTVSLRSRIQLKRAYYDPSEYEMLREFFNWIVKKHSEQIVLKKKK